MAKVWALVASKFALGYPTRLSIQQNCLTGQLPWPLKLQGSFTDQPEGAAACTPVDRISLYSSTDRPLKLVSLGRGYWSRRAERERESGERVSSADKLSTC